MANKPGAVQATLNTVLVSAMEFMHEPAVAAKLIGRYPGQSELGWLKEFGMMEKVNADEFHWHEENLIFDNPFIASVAQIGVSNGIRITLKAESHTGGGAYSYPRIGNIIELPNGFQGLINAKDGSVNNAHTIDVYPVADDTAAPISYATFAAGLAADQQFFLPSTAFAEGSKGMEQSLQPSTTTFKNKLQKNSDFYKVTFEESRNQTYIPFKNKRTGEEGRYLYIKGMYDTEVRFMLQEEMGLFIQQESGNLLKNAAQEQVRTTRGMIPHLRLHAEQLNYSAAGGVTSLFYDEAVRIFKRNHSGDHHVLLQGFDFMLRNKDFFVDFGVSNPAIFIDGKGINKEIALQFKRLSIGNHIIDTRELNILSHAQLAGTPGFGYKDMAIFMPMKKFKDSRSGEMMKAFTVMYKEQYGEGAKGHFKIYETGAYASSGAKDAELTRKIHFVSDKGGRFAGAKEWIFVQKTA